MTTDQRILDAALTLFLERGFHGVGTAAIGKAAGISGPAIYKHFASKDEILAAIFHDAMARLQLHLTLPSEDAWHDLDCLVDAMVAFALQDRDLVLIYVQEQRFLVDPGGPRFDATSWTTWPDGSRQSPAADLISPAGDHRSMAWALNEMLLSIASWGRQARGNPRLPQLMRGLARDGVRQVQIDT